MPVRGLRGATTVDVDEEEAILNATGELLQALLQANPALQAQDIVSAWFTATADLHAAFPARAARQMGWTETALMCAQEMTVQGGLERCIRVLLHWNTDLPQAEVKHVYLREARSLRPDLEKDGQSLR
jgi:chorismate mutase